MQKLSNQTKKKTTSSNEIFHRKIYTVNDRLTVQGSIKHPVQTGTQSWGKTSYEHPGRNYGCLNAYLKPGTSLIKRRKKIFVINFKSKFDRNIIILKKIWLAWYLLPFLLFFLISAQAWLSAQSEEMSTQKLLIWNRCPGQLIDQLQYFLQKYEKNI